MFNDWALICSATVCYLVFEDDAAVYWSLGPPNNPFAICCKYVSSYWHHRKGWSSITVMLKTVGGMDRITIVRDNHCKPWRPQTIINPNILQPKGTIHDLKILVIANTIGPWNRLHVATQLTRTAAAGAKGFHLCQDDLHLILTEIKTVASDMWSMNTTWYKHRFKGCSLQPTIKNIRKKRDFPDVFAKCHPLFVQEWKGFRVILQCLLWVYFRYQAVVNNRVKWKFA